MVRESSQPLIGITSYDQEATWGVWNRPAALIPHSYVHVMVDVGAVPVLLPSQPAGGAARALAALDGLVIAGGADVDPVHYNARPHANTEASEPERDRWELALARSAIAAGLPLLGVCRGMQVVNVALGGDLDQHLPDTLGVDGHRAGVARFAARRVHVEPGSGLAGILGETSTVRCYHHQAVRRLGQGLRPVAWAEDGTVEAIESDQGGFLLAVQWHPEEDAHDRRLFAALAAASVAHAQRVPSA